MAPKICRVGRALINKEWEADELSTKEIQIGLVAKQGGEDKRRELWIGKG
jgi:hypothetical protein